MKKRLSYLLFCSLGLFACQKEPSTCECMRNHDNGFPDKALQKKCVEFQKNWQAEYERATEDGKQHMTEAFNKEIAECK